MTLFEAFETPMGARETDRTWRSMVARARHDYLALLMPVWAGVLTFATLLLGFPGLYLLGQATGLATNPSIETALATGTLAGSLQLVSGWLSPLAETLSPTQNRFGLEVFILGALLILAVASMIRAVGSRQWFQSVYDDLPRRRLLLTGVLWLILPVILAFLLFFKGALVEATAPSPRVVVLLVAVLAVVVLTLCLSLIYLTFSVREPAFPSVLVGAFFAALALVFVYAILSALPGLGRAPDGTVAPLRALVSLSIFVFAFWSIFLAGSQLAVSLARRRDPIAGFLNASRGEQLDFALGLIRDMEDQTRSRRWAHTAELSLSLAAPTAMVTFVLDRLRRSGIVGFADDGARPPTRWAIKDDLESLTLNDLSRAMGTSLDPHPGLHGRPSEEVIADLAEREHLSQSQNLLSLFRAAPDLPPVGEPMLAVANASYGLDDISGFAPSGGFQPLAQVVDRGQGDNGGPPDEDSEGQTYVFVDGSLSDDSVLNMHAGPSALFDQDEAGADAGEDDGLRALDLTLDMKRSTLDAEDEAEDEAEDGDDAAEDGAEDGDEDAPARALPLGPESPLAAVQGEIDNLIEHEAEADAKADAKAKAKAAPAVPPVAPLASWKHSAPAQAPEVPDSVEGVEAVAAWRAVRAPARRVESVLTAPAARPLPAQRSWWREAKRPAPLQSWKQGSAEADRLFVPIAPEPATIEPSRRFDFGSKSADTKA